MAQFLLGALDIPLIMLSTFTIRTLNKHSASPGKKEFLSSAFKESESAFEGIIKEEMGL